MDIHVAFSVSWWITPAVVTVLAFLWVFYWPVDERGFCGGTITRAFMMIPALAIIAVAWMLTAVFTHYK